MINKIVPIYDTLYSKRENLFLTLDKGKNLFLDASLQGTGKTTFFLRACGKYNHTTIILLDNHDKAMEVYDDWKQFNNPVVSYMVSRTYKCNSKMKQAISEILGIDFKDKYVCNKCNKDKQVLELYEKKYIENDNCWEGNCDERERKECVYFKLKEHSLRKQKFKENRLIILVKSYLYTKYFQEELIFNHENYSLIIDEGMLECMTKMINFSRSFISNKMYHDWIKMVDKLVEIVNEPQKLLTTLWKEIKEFYQLVLNYKLTIEEREEKILECLLKLFFNHNFEDDYLKWNELLKNNVNYYYFFKKELPNLIPNQFLDLQGILEHIFLISWYFENEKGFQEELFKNEIKKCIFINLQNKEFNFIINYKEEIEGYIKDSLNSSIPASNLEKDFFNELLPNFKDKLVYFNSDFTHKFKVVHQKKYGSFFKSTLCNPITKKDDKTGKIINKFTKEYYNLLNDLEYILTREKNKKILVVAQKTISNKLKYDLRNILKNRNELVNNTVSIEYYYNLEGKNKFQHYDVVVLFGGAGIPPKLLKILSKMLNVSISKLWEYFVPNQHIQCMERLRSILYPYQKVVYVLCDVKLPIPQEQLVKFGKVQEIDFLEKLKERGASNVNECLEIYNTINNKNSKKTISIQQMRNILNRMIKDDIIMKYKYNNGVGRSVFYYTISIKNTIENSKPNLEMKNKLVIEKI